MPRCVACDQPLYPQEQGALCSPCYFKAICNPDTAAADRDIRGPAGVRRVEGADALPGDRREQGSERI